MYRLYERKVFIFVRCSDLNRSDRNRNFSYFFSFFMFIYFLFVCKMRFVAFCISTLYCIPRNITYMYTSRFTCHIIGLLSIFSLCKRLLSYSKLYQTFAIAFQVVPNSSSACQISSCYELAINLTSFVKHLSSFKILTSACKFLQT